MNKPGNPSIQSISGEISSVRSFGNKGWATAMLLTDGQLIRCTGTPLASLREGMNYSLTGKFVHHPRFGLQFDVRAAEIDLAVDRVALQKHIAKSFKNIGPKTAERIVAAFEKAGQLEFLRDQLVYTPECLDFSPYTRRAAEFQGDNTFEEVVIRDFSVRLKSIHEVHTGLIKRLGQFYAQRILVKHPVNPDKNNGAIDPNHIKAAWQAFLEDPFDPLSEVKGYGFKAADAVRIYLGMPDDAPCRLVALVSYVLRLTCEQGGHSYLSYHEITRGITLLDPQIDPQTAIAYSTEHSRHLKIDGSRYYPLHLYIAETQFAKRLALRRAKPIAPIYKESPEKLDGAIVAAELSMGANFKLDDTQRAAVRGLLLSTSSVHTLTAGPGCGKTAIMEIISRIVHRQCQMLFCAPTGKAAKVLRSRIAHIGKLDALTIHSLLGPDEEGGFKHNEANLLKVDVLTADETSMMDLSISNDLFSAVPLTSHIILLGDTQQLPSIGPGDVLHDLLRIQGFDHHRLNRTHRNTGGILDVISKAGAGVVDGIDRSDVTFRGDLPSVTPEGFASVISDYDDALFQENNKFAAVGFIVPKRKGDAYTPGWNVTHLNQLLRNRYNPNAVAVPGTPLFVNDRVLIRKNQTLRQLHLAVNNAESETPSEVVVNGDTGTICAVSTVEKKGIVVADHLMIDLDDGRRIYYPGNAVDDLDHAYAITCHASQGSEYRRVIFLCTDGPPSFMNRSIVFTALSRAKTDLKVWGSIPKLQRICRHTRPARNSALIETASYLYKQLV